MYNAASFAGLGIKQVQWFSQLQLTYVLLHHVIECFITEQADA